MRPLNIDGVFYVLVEDEDRNCDACVFDEKEGKWCNKLTAILRNGKHDNYTCSSHKHYKQMEVEDIPKMKGKPINVKNINRS